ncbi:MAG: DUF4212 domain-containing protein [Burkholderiales bacterium]|nr:DUF4212 domain-containing protein [Burkholderiales bacterium]
MATSRPEGRRNQYWRRTKRLTAVLLFIWAALSFTILFFARELSGWRFFGWPFPFYMAAQGLALLYVLILAIYSLGMRYISTTEEKE